MSIRSWYRWTAWALWYEPSWHVEAGMAIAMFGWALGALLTDDYVVSAAATGMAVFALLFGPLRAFLLLRRWYGARMLMAFVSALWWGALWLALTHTVGAVPGQGPLEGLFAMDVFVMLRFSIPATVAILHEMRRDPA